MHTKNTPVRLIPAYKDYLWGGDRLRTLFHKPTDMTPLAESWELSTHPDGESRIALPDGSTEALSAYLKDMGSAALGTRAGGRSDMPLLIKFIDAKQNLSVQVHPTAAYAKSHPGAEEKNEMWYIIDSEPDAFIYYGFRRDITREEYENAIRNHTLTDLLNRVPTHKGDAFYIPAGTVHAIGAGNLICEIQQNANTTYRVFDYNRLDKNGKPRDLHIEQALEVSALKAMPAVKPTPDGADALVCRSDYFEVRRHRVAGTASIAAQADSFVCLMATEGEGQITGSGTTIAFHPGDSLFIPAGEADYRVEGHCELVDARLGLYPYGRPADTAETAETAENELYIGIDLGGTNIAAGLVDGSGRLIRKDSVPTLKERPIGEVVADMVHLAQRITREAGHELSEICAVGIGSPGTVDRDHGMVVYSNNLVMDHFPLSDEFRALWDVPVNLENDANAAAYGEYFVCEDHPKGFVMITLGTGVGGGIILDGKILRGFNQAGGEVGHMTLVKDGAPCTCGRKGCFEAYASVTGLIAQTKAAMEAHPETAMHDWVRRNGSISGRTAFDCARDHDPVATEVRDRYIQYVADGVCSLINIFQPERFVIGGGISHEGDTLLEPIRAYLERYGYNRYMTRTEVRAATLYGDAGIIGAAMAAKN